MATRDRYGENIDVLQRHGDSGNEEESSDNIVALIGRSVFHSKGSIQKDGLISEETYVDFGDDGLHGIGEALSEILAKGAENGLSEKGEKTKE